MLGKPMIQRVYEQASLSSASRVVVATDDQRIADAVTDFGGDVCLTREDHVSGTDRVHEVTRKLGLNSNDCVVNVQGDEPLIPPIVIDQVANLLIGSEQPMATLCEPIDSLEDLMDPNIVKVVMTDRGVALYFSRAPIPWARDELPGNYTGGAFRHIGIYGYRVELLEDFVTWREGVLEQIEKLEQLRVMENGRGISIAAAVETIPPGVDTARDLERTLAAISGLT